MEIPEEKLNYLEQLATVNEIPLADLKNMYQKIIDTGGDAFDGEEELFEYSDNVIASRISEWHTDKTEEVTFMCIGSTAPFESNGVTRNNIIGLTKRDGKIKICEIIASSDNGPVVRIDPLAIITAKLSIGNNGDKAVTMYNRNTTTYTEAVLDWVPENMAERTKFLAKAIKKVKIIEASKNRSHTYTAASGKTYPVGTSVRHVRGVISTRMIRPQKNNPTRKFGMIKITDSSIAVDPDFMKNSEDADGNVIYGGFGMFIDPEDIENVGIDSDCDFYGYIIDAHNFQPVSLIPRVLVEPKQATDKLQIPDSNIDTGAGESIDMGSDDDLGDI